MSQDKNYDLYLIQEVYPATEALMKASTELLISKSSW
jgi:hypothetical protein